jgi:phage baseplate assembly protein gpV
MGSEHVLVNQVVHDDNHADALAQSELDARVAREAILSGVAEGDPRLRPGARVTVSGVLNELAGQYVLTSVTHTVDARSGFVSEFSTQPPARRRRVATAATALGTVTRVDDPQRLGRIKVALPAYGNVETDWLGVLFPGAGPNKGLMCLPDVQDLVLVIFGSEDPSQGIVLGGLYGARGAPDSGVEDAATRRYTLLTAGGLRIRLDDKQQIVRLEDSTGSYFELTPGGVRVHAAVDMVLEAPGKSVVIRGQSIDFQRA